MMNQPISVACTNMESPWDENIFGIVRAFMELVA